MRILLILQIWPKIIIIFRIIRAIREISIKNIYRVNCYIVPLIINDFCCKYRLVVNNIDHPFRPFAVSGDVQASWYAKASASTRGSNSGLAISDSSSLCCLTAKLYIAICLTFIHLIHLLCFSPRAGGGTNIMKRGLNTSPTLSWYRQTPCCRNTSKSPRLKREH